MTVQFSPRRHPSYLAPFDELEVQPPRLDLLAIDLSNKIDADSGEEYIVMRLIDRTGLRLDCPLPAHHAAEFGRSLAEFAEDL